MHVRRIGDHAAAVPRRVMLPRGAMLNCEHHIHISVAYFLQPKQRRQHPNSQLRHSKSSSPRRSAPLLPSRLLLPPRRPETRRRPPNHRARRLLLRRLVTTLDSLVRIAHALHPRDRGRQHQHSPPSHGNNSTTLNQSRTVKFRNPS